MHGAALGCTHECTRSIWVYTRVYTPDSGVHTSVRTRLHTSACTRARVAENYARVQGARLTKGAREHVAEEAEHVALPRRVVAEAHRDEVVDIAHLTAVQPSNETKPTCGTAS